MVRLILKIDAQLINQLASIVAEWVIIHLCADLLIAVPVLLKSRGFTPRRQVKEATEIPEAKSNDKSDLDIVRLMKAYGLSNISPQTSQK